MRRFGGRKKSDKHTQNEPVDSSHYSEYNSAQQDGNGHPTEREEQQGNGDKQQEDGSNDSNTPTGQETRSQPAHPEDSSVVHIDEYNNLKKLLDEKTRIADDYLNRLRYLQAEFDNYKKWTEKDKAEFTKVANEKLVRSILPVLDNLQKALETAGNEKSAFRDGIDLIYVELMGIMKGIGLMPMDTLGKRFDPFRHEAISCEARDDLEDGIITEELQRGYTLNDRVIRTAKVKISKKPEKSDTVDEVTAIDTCKTPMANKDTTEKQKEPSDLKETDSNKG